MATPGRNEPCPCGSGKKYKHCCAVARVATPAVATIDALFAEALRLHQTGHLAPADALYQRILATAPDHADALHLHGVVALQQGRSDDAACLIARAITHNGAVPSYHNNLGNALRKQGCADEAITAYRTALRLNPTYADARRNLGNVLAAGDDLVGAAEQYRAALHLEPDDADTHNRLGTVLHRSGDLPAAQVAFAAATRLAPELAEAWYHLGLTYQDQGRLEQAIASYGQAVTLQPDLVEAHNNLGSMLLRLDRRHEAIAAYRTALQLAPTFVDAMYNLGNTLVLQGDLPEALTYCRSVLQRQPDYAPALDPLVRCLQGLYLWDDLDEQGRRLRGLLRTERADTVNPFTLLALESTPEEQLACARATAAKITHHRPVDAPRYTHRLGPRERLHIGYLSADLRQHPVADLLVETLELHDRTRVAVSAYALTSDDGSALRRRCVAACDRFVDLHALSITACAQQIYDDGVDLLVDLTGYTTSSRPGVLALRPAPVQVNFLGFPGTMGADFIDYLIADRFIVPPTQQHHYSERLAYLPEVYQPSDRQRPSSPHTPTRSALGLPDHAFVFCCFNNSYKLTPTIFALWMRLLAQLPQAVLWLSAVNDQVVLALRRAAEAQGIAPDRLIFAPRLPIADYRALYRRADLFLDTLPYNAGATANDALWEGLPLLTCAGRTYVGRMAGSLLHATGLPELVTSSLEEYEALALRLAQRPDELAALRARLADNRDTCPLFDTPRFVATLEETYQELWNDTVSRLHPF